jgi:hypothetical protein
MVLERPTADIAYALAMGHVGNPVLLDELRIGPQTQSVTGPQGAYTLGALPAGDYRLQALGPDGETVSLTEPLVTFAEGESLAAVNLAGSVTTASWQNPLLAEDVTGEGFVTALDALNIINWINEHPNDASLPAAPIAPPPYLDVDGSGFLTAQDVLFVVNYINQTTAQQAGGEPAGFAAAGIAEGEPPAPGRAATRAFVAAANDPIEWSVAAQSRDSRVSVPRPAATATAFAESPAFDSPEARRFDDFAADVDRLFADQLGPLLPGPAL